MDYCDRARLVMAGLATDRERIVDLRKCLVAQRNILDDKHAGPTIEDLGNNSINTLNFQLKRFTGAPDQGLVIVERDERFF